MKYLIFLQLIFALTIIFPENGSSKMDIQISENSISFSIEKEKLVSILAEISRQTNVMFDINSSLSDEIITANIYSRSLNESLTRLLNNFNTSIIYDNTNNIIEIKIFEKINNDQTSLQEKSAISNKERLQTSPTSGLNEQLNSEDDLPPIIQDEDFDFNETIINPSESLPEEMKKFFPQNSN